MSPLEIGLIAAIFVAAIVWAITYTRFEKMRNNRDYWEGEYRQKSKIQDGSGLWYFQGGILHGERRMLPGNVTWISISHQDDVHDSRYEDLYRASGGMMVFDCRRMYPNKKDKK